MEEIKVGDFVRTKEGIIDKVTIDYKGKCNNPNCNYKHISCKCNYYDEENIVKHSSNIKDLVQAGDVVIYTINCKMTDIEIVKEHTDSRTLEKSLRVGLWSLEQVDIKQILTKEKFESESYRLEE